MYALNVKIVYFMKRNKRGNSVFCLKNDYRIHLCTITGEIYGYPKA